MASIDLSGAANSKKRKILFMLLNEVSNDDEIELDLFQLNRNSNKNNNVIAGLLADNSCQFERQRVIPIRIKDYVEKIVPHYTLTDFKSHFRMSKLAVEVSI